MRRIPRWAWVVGILLALLLVAALVIPRFLNVDRYRTLIAGAMEEATGRQVHIGAIRASLLPSVGFVLEDFRIANPPEFPEGYLLTAEAIRGNLAWGPLLRREFQLSSVVVVRPRVELLEDARGRKNYDFTGPAGNNPAPRASAETKDDSFRLAELDSLRLEDLELLLGNVSGGGRAEPVVAPLLTAKGITARLEELAFDAARFSEWKADANLRGVRLEVSGLPGAIEFRSGKFALREGGAESEFEADVAGAARMRGRLSIPDVRNVRATFDVSAPRVNLAALAAAAGAAAAPSRAAAAPGPVSRTLLAEGRVRLEKIEWAPYELSGSEARVRVYGDRIQVEPFAAAFYGGRIEGAARLERGRTPQRFSASLRATGVDVAALLAADPATRGKMTGTGELRLEVSGDTAPKAGERLTGNGDFAIRDGGFPGLDLTQALDAVGRLQRALNLGEPGTAAGETRFSVLRGDLAIRNSRIRSQQVHLDSEAGTVDLQGSVGFDGTLDYQGRAVLTASEEEGRRRPADLLGQVLGGVLGQQVQKMSIPFALRGTLQNPTVQPGRGLPGVQTAPREEPQQQEDSPTKGLRDLLRRP